jgi:hypothetical protein
MKLISHRGNIDGQHSESENHPQYIETALNIGFEVEVDIWVEDSKLFLGHDMPQYEVDIDWLSTRKDKFWIHCKNVSALQNFYSIDRDGNNFNYFWHQTDLLTLTSKNYIWAYPGNQPMKNSIAVLPEMYSDVITNCIGICSDFILKYRDEKI